MGTVKARSSVAPESVMTETKAKLMHIFGWQGKVFDAKHGTVVNKILVTGTHAIAAQVYKDKSWYDEKEWIAIDYSKTSLVAGWVCDEIRQIGPRTYLGLVFMGKKKTIDFGLACFRSEAGHWLTARLITHQSPEFPASNELNMKGNNHNAAAICRAGGSVARNRRRSHLRRRARNPVHTAVRREA